MVLTQLQLFITMQCAWLQVPDELYFATLACHPQRRANLPISNTRIRYVHWPKNGGSNHPSKIDLDLVELATESGCLFARKVGLCVMSSDSAFKHCL